MKDSFIVTGLGGKKTLSGSIAVRGAKNAVLPAMASALLFKDTLTITNVPLIQDVDRMAELLTGLGVTVEKTSTRRYQITVTKAVNTSFATGAAEQLRASIILTGPTLARFGSVSFPHPGGCVIGPRPIDLFLDGFKKMGAHVKITKNHYRITTKEKKLHGATIFFRVISVTATETFMMAATLAEGKTVLKNAALEPEIKHLADFLNSCGANIKGAGTATIEIEGTGLLQAQGKKYTTLPDRIEAGSFLILGALSADDLLITDCNPEHVSMLIELLQFSGVPIEVEKSSIRIKNNGKKRNRDFKALNIRTHEYPGFATDLQAPMVVYLTQVTGQAVVFETIFEGRLQYTSDLVRMGADITMWDPQRVMITGPRTLRSRELEGPDLRAGLAFVIAAIVAKGRSVINNVYYIDRGYESIEERLQNIGVSIERTKNKEM